MPDFFDTVVTIITGAVSAIVAYRYQSKRDARTAHVNRMKYVWHALQEALKALNIELMHIDQLAERLETSPESMYQLKTSASPAFNILTEIMLDDEYFFAYSRLFSNELKADESYFRLQYLAPHLRSQLTQIRDEVMPGALSRDHD